MDTTKQTNTLGSIKYSALLIIISNNHAIKLFDGPQESATFVPNQQMLLNYFDPTSRCQNVDDSFFQDTQGDE